MEHQTDPVTSWLTHLFFAHKRLVALLKQFLETILVNCTYKTNRFWLPLFVIVGVTSLNITFYATFAFLAQEKELDYSWAL